LIYKVSLMVLLIKWSSKSLTFNNYANLFTKKIYSKSFWRVSEWENYFL
jgi:hypothetical protein